jgi:uncharacterized repeat protein (TIGR01451 family)
VGAQADLAVSVAGPASATEGDSLTYTVTVTNNDAANAGTGVVLTDTLGANLSYLSATASQGTFSASGGAVTFNLGTLAPGASATLTVTARATEDGTLSDSATVSATSGDPASANNSATASTAVAEAPIVVSGPITVTGKNANNIVVATFTHANGVEPASAFRATIDWGDGKTSTGTITLSGTTYTVTDSHRYSKPGSHTVTTTVTEIGQAAELLLAKAGDEEPDLPDRYPGNPDHGRPALGGQADRFAELLASYLAPGPAAERAASGEAVGRVAAPDPRSELTLQLDGRALESRQPPLAFLGNLGARREPDARPRDVLGLLDELVAE